MSYTYKYPYLWCAFCQTSYDIDYPQIDVSPNDGRARCPYDHKRLELCSADVEVG